MSRHLSKTLAQTISLLALTTLVLGSLAMSTPVQAQSFCPAGGSGDGRTGGVNPKGNNISTLDPVAGTYTLPADGSGLPFAYSSQLATNESPAYRIVLSLYKVDTGRIAYTYSNGSDPATLEFTFTEPGSYYFVKNLIYAAHTVCTAYFIPDTIRPVCGTTAGTTDTASLLNYFTCSECSSGPVPYCREALNHISVGSAEQLVEILPALPTSTPTVTPTATNTPTPTNTPTASPTPTATPTGAPTATPTPSPSPTHAPTPSPTPTGVPPVTASAWWQVYAGHVSSVNGITSRLPASYYLSENSVLSADPDTAGAVLSTNGLIQLGTGLSTNNKNFHDSRITGSQSSVCSQFSFSSIRQLVNLESVPPKTGNVVYQTLEKLVEDSTTVVQSGGARVLYIKDGNLTLTPSDTWLYTDADYPLLIFVENGSIEIDGKAASSNSLLQLSSSSFVAFFTTGDITILGSAGNYPPGPVAPNLATITGVFVADGTLTIDNTGSDLTEKQFVGYGSFTGCKGVNLTRSFDSLINAATPAEVFIYNPNLLRNAPLIIMDTLINWNEL